MGGGGLGGGVSVVWADPITLDTEGHMEVQKIYYYYLATSKSKACHYNILQLN